MKTYKIKIIKIGKIIHTETVDISDSEIKDAMQKLQTNDASHAAKALAIRKAEPIRVEHNGNWIDAEEIKEHVA